MRKTVFIISLLLFIKSNLFAQEFLSYQQCIDMALEQNFSIKIARNHQQISENNHALGNAGFLPNINLTAAQNNTVADTRQEFLSGQINEIDGAKSNSFNTNLSLNWTVFDGLNMFVSYDRLNELKEMGELQTRMALESMLAEVTQSYFYVVRQIQVYDAMVEALEISKLRVNIAHDKYVLGAQSKMELLNARVDFNADSSLLLRQSEAVKNAKIQLNRLLALNIRSDFLVADTIELLNQLLYVELEQSLVNNNINLLLAEREKIISELDLKLINSRRYPVIEANLGYNFTQAESQSGFLLTNQSRGLTYGLTASLNIFDGFNQSRLRKNALIDIKIQELIYRKLEETVISEFEAAFVTYENDIRLLQLETQNLEVARQNLDIALERYRLGASSGIELREVQKNLLDAESRLINVRYEAKVSETFLLQITGKILDLIN